MTLAALLPTKFKISKFWHCVYRIIYPNRTNVVLNPGKLLFNPEVIYDFHCIEFGETHS
jgi:hypothetical protein